MLSLVAGSWIVETTTTTNGAGRDNLMPAVKHYLTDRSVEFWKVPGMLVFKLRPSDNE